MEQISDPLDSASAIAASAAENSNKWARNDYYRVAFQSVLFIVNFQVVIIFVLTCGLLFYMNKEKISDRFIAETNEGRKMQMAGLSLPNMGSVALTNWVALAVSEVMTFGFNDINDRFAESRYNFTAEGWKSFSKAMMESGFAQSVIDAQQIITSVPRQAPVLKQEGLIRGKYTWTFELNLLITFRSGSVKQPQIKTVNVLLEQIPTSENPNGVGIAEWYIF